MWETLWSLWSAVKEVVLKGRKRGDGKGGDVNINGGRAGVSIKGGDSGAGANAAGGAVNITGGTGVSKPPDP